MKHESRFLLLRRVVAFLYDSLLLIAIYFCTTAVAISFNDGEAVRGPLFQILLLIIAGVFFCSFWKHGGQTLGMRAWRIRVIDKNGGNPGWKDSIRRFVTGTLLLGVTWLAALFSKQGLALHDRLSNTRIIRDK